MNATAQQNDAPRVSSPILRFDMVSPRARRLSDRIREAEGRDALVSLLDELGRRLRSRTCEPFPRLDMSGTRHQAEAFYRAIQLQRLHDEYHLLLDRTRVLRARAESVEEEELEQVGDEAARVAARFREQETLEASLLQHRWVGAPEAEAR